ncbi:type II toxin-antitoxin system RelB/DinJ family antitoxin [Leptospira bandrabouensis]|uniref:type II toxin-antitoxin system RelB/DinJ family antitoxin n=1 Tax=Leptospira TaxID=171 RepID=UPI001EEAAC88|nr:MULTISPECIES: type II toxin-antitoxin system RelB/DinJ family antitoxin [Leptospira]MCG6138961.1 type II toxin-antitoxin system RelB/DinJ family antitoxin [Leptospira mtsangambouensis]MCW7459802.1 type II toxin-antitoxin system RelB/DinJ family antitoxin [Leptospira bandrabouensis]MCW7479287.1 type II toxin-antitoxin system RelB/DinJ family antitoxin [Leptospira bandrabouensis]MCW7486918.1 type II toxin-antitoxin system RelB/DinJ family antitoxin [Leptospira bandrabouensis]
MAKTAMIRARVEDNLKKDVENILERLGLSTSEAINIFYHQIKLTRGIPFAVKMPNKITKKTLESTDKNQNLKTFKSKKELFENLGI